MSQLSMQPNACKAQANHDIQILLDNCRYSMYFSYRIYTPETMTELAKRTFGPDVKVNVYFDLKPPAESPEEDACWVTYVIEKP